MKTRRIMYEDDLVFVKDPAGTTIYNGMEDYEPMKYEDWTWDDAIQGYFLEADGGRYTKYCRDC